MIPINDTNSSNYDWSRKVTAVESADLVNETNANAGVIELAIRTANLHGRLDLVEKWKSLLSDADSDDIINTYEEMKTFFLNTKEGVNFITELNKKEILVNKKTSISATPNDENYLTEKAVKIELDKKSEIIGTGRLWLQGATNSIAEQKGIAITLAYDDTKKMYTITHNYGKNNFVLLTQLSKMSWATNTNTLEGRDLNKFEIAGGGNDAGNVEYIIFKN